MGFLEERSDGVVLTIVVRPESEEEGFRVEGDELVFSTPEPPVRGRANAALVRALARLLGIRPSDVEIVYGARSRVKRVALRRVRAGDVLRALGLE